MTNPPLAHTIRYSVIANKEQRTLRVWDAAAGCYLNREDYIGAEQHDALIAQARAQHPELRRYRVARITHG